MGRFRWPSPALLGTYFLIMKNMAKVFNRDLRIGGSGSLFVNEIKVVDGDGAIGYSSNGSSVTQATSRTT